MKNDPVFRCSLSSLSSLSSHLVYDTHMNFSEDPINPFIEPDGLIEPEIEPTDDGSQTLRHPLFGETYHSVRGAEGEARHVYIDAGFH